MGDFSDHLNSAQREAVMAGHGALLILAGAGTGKTRVLTHRIARLLHEGTPAHRILAVTFTNKAANEMRTRLEGLCGGVARGLWVGTFHAIAAKLLRIHAAEAGVDPKFVIYDDDDQRRIVARLLKEAGIVESVRPRQVLSRIDDAKNHGLGVGELVARSGNGRVDEVTAELYPRYQAALARERALDFGDLLLEALRFARSTQGERLRRRFDEVLVDEFQDTNRVQYDLVCALAKGSGGLTVVGDDDQAIYGWRGADVRNLLDFEREHQGARLIKLEENYRSTPIILGAANAVIGHALERKGKTLFTARKGGAPILFFLARTEREEAELVARAIQQLRREEGRRPCDFAVLYRTHAQSRALEEALRSARMPYAVVGGQAFYGRREIKDMLSYLRLAAPGPARDLDVERVINVPARGIGEGTVEKLRRIREGFAGSPSLFDACEASVTEPVPAASGILGSAARRRLAEFVTLIVEIRAARARLGLSALAKEILARTGLEQTLFGDGAPEERSRVENVRELVAALQDFEENALDPSLEAFLEHAALESPADGSADGEGEGEITLMTIHAAKGLEFPVVVLTGLEEGIFPSLPSGSLADLMSGAEDGGARLDEERRLAYVALTRAKERLLLTLATQRRVYDTIRQQMPSRFLMEIPRELVAEVRPAGAQRRPPPTPPGQPLRRAPSRSPGEVYVEYEEPAAEIPVGARVRHERYGFGTVQGCSGRGRDAKLRIDFGRDGEKTVLARFLEPA